MPLHFWLLRLAQSLRRNGKGNDSTTSSSSSADEEKMHMIITKNDSKVQSRQKIKQSFLRNRVVMTVASNDILPTADETDGEEDSVRNSCLILPRSEKHYGTTHVPGNCVICLDSYRPNDVVVWSSNPDCQHAFHRDCALRYLIRIHKKVAMTPCCVCRCQFTDLQVEKREPCVRRRGRGNRPTVRTQNTYYVSSLPCWLTRPTRTQSSSP